MPRSEKLMGCQLYSSHQKSSTKKKHICITCERAFTTSGHLSRHSRVHTGERNHRCPFPGCETRCSRQDNLQQHYRIHLSPGSRRNSARIKAPRKPASASASPRAPANSESTTSKHLPTPHIEEGRVIAHLYHFSPDSTPPLIQVSLPSASTHPHPRISPTSTPSSSYSPNTHHILPSVSSQDLSLPVSSPLSYSHRSGTAYQSPANSYRTSLNDPTGASQISSYNAVDTGNPTYSHSHSNYGDQSQQHSRSTSPSPSMPSRRSLSHISNPRYPSSHGLPSPISVSSHTSAHSGPPTPTYHFYADTHTYSHPHSAAVSIQSAANNNQIHSQSYLFQNVYTPNVVAPRYLPPLTLAPIQDERYTRRLETPRYSQTHNSPYFHHSQPLTGYHHSIGLGHSTWKSDMRKGIGAVI